MATYIVNGIRMALATLGPLVAFLGSEGCYRMQLMTLEERVEIMKVNVELRLRVGKGVCEEESACVSDEAGNGQSF